jgi:hypothetical protein
MTARTWRNGTAAIGLMATVALMATPGLARAENPHIDLAVKESGGVAEVVFLNSACPNGQRGCIEMPRGQSNWISWELDLASQQAGWSLESLYFGTADKQIGNLKDCTLSAFGLTEEDQRTGLASTAEIFGNGKRLRIWDENDQECVTHYTINAVNTGSGQTAKSDPLINNRGRL